MHDPITAASVMPTAATLTVEVRHGRECPHRKEPSYKRCTCRKQLYIYENGKDHTESAKTRSWEEAERQARERKGELDPVRIAAHKLDQERARLIAQEEQKRIDAEARRITIPAALAEWRAGCRIKSDSQERQRNTIAAKFSDWAEERGLTYLDEATPTLLRGWVNKWSPNAANSRDRLKGSSQTTYLFRLKTFFAWAVEARRLDHNPLKIVWCEKERDDDSHTRPLYSDEQFRLILNATYRYDEDRLAGVPLYGRDMRAIFLLQRGTGIRVGDAVALRRTAIKRGPGGIYLMTIRTQKTGALIKDRPLPMAVVEALQAVPEQDHVREGYYFWSKGCQLKYLANMWRKRVSDLNAYFSLTDDNGEPMRFRSHMLRDTFAVELLMAENPPVPIEEVSELLTHKSIQMTQRFYAPWIAKRRDKMHRNMMQAMESMGMSFTPTVAAPVNQATTPRRIM